MHTFGGKKWKIRKKYEKMRNNANPISPSCRFQPIRNIVSPKNANMSKTMNKTSWKWGLKTGGKICLQRSILDQCRGARSTKGGRTTMVGRKGGGSAAFWCPPLQSSKLVCKRLPTKQIQQGEFAWLFVASSSVKLHLYPRIGRLWIYASAAPSGGTSDGGSGGSCPVGTEDGAGALPVGAGQPVRVEKSVPALFGNGARQWLACQQRKGVWQRQPRKTITDGKKRTIKKMYRERMHGWLK